MIKTRLPELMLAFSKFGVLGPSELVNLLEGQICRSQSYRYLAELWKLKLVRRRAHSWSKVDAFEATHALLRATREDSVDVFRPLKEDELRHRIACVHVLIGLCRREFITGVALEHEIGSEEISRFCPRRVPDGIIEISQPGSASIEFALEVELSAKTRDRAGEILDIYEQTIRDGKHLCRGVLLVTGTDACFSLYESLLKERPASFRDWVLLSKDLDLSDVNENTLGHKLNTAHEHPRKPCESRRIVTHEGIKYLNDFSISSHLKGYRSVAGQLTARVE